MKNLTFDIIQGFSPRIALITSAKHAALCIKHILLIFLYLLTCLLSMLNKLVPTKAQLIAFSEYLLGFIVMIIISIIFMILFLRALDIEASAQAQVLEQHQDYLEIKLPNDAE